MFNIHVGYSTQVYTGEYVLLGAEKSSGKEPNL